MSTHSNTFNYRDSRAFNGPIPSSYFTSETHNPYGFKPTCTSRNIYPGQETVSASGYRWRFVGLDWSGRCIFGYSFEPFDQSRYSLAKFTQIYNDRVCAKYDGDLAFTNAYLLANASGLCIGSVYYGAGEVLRDAYGTMVAAVWCEDAPEWLEYEGETCAYSITQTLNKRQRREGYLVTCLLNECYGDARTPHGWVRVATCSVGEYPCPMHDECGEDCSTCEGSGYISGDTGDSVVTYWRPR